MNEEQINLIIQLIDVQIREKISEINYEINGEDSLWYLRQEAEDIKKKLLR